MTNYEKETIISFNEVDEECEVYTYNQRLINKLKKKCSSNGKLYKLIGDDGMGGLTFRVPKSLLSVNFRDPLTEEQREALRQRALINGFGKQPQEHGEYAGSEDTDDAEGDLSG